jgi:SAM-dependent methyltransferase
MSKPTDPGSRALSFGSAAGDYDRLRPGYPDPAVRWTLGEAPLRVVDVGAGTGILTRALSAHGHRVFPVEPDPQMAAHLAARSPGCTPVIGYAERLPLAERGVDAVVAGQAYHWFDPEPAHAEAARVLRPGGVFAALWNHRDESVPWVAELAAVSDDDTAGRGVRDPMVDIPSLGAGFGPVRRAVFPHSVTLTPDDLVALIATRSYFLTATAARRRELERRVRRLCESDPVLAGRAEFSMPYRCVVYRAVRTGT